MIYEGTSDHHPNRNLVGVYCHEFHLRHPRPFAGSRNTRSDGELPVDRRLSCSMEHTTAPQRLAAQQSRHNRHLALNTKALGDIPVDARRGAYASPGGALRRPFGLAPVIIRHVQHSG
jgi:hypothetical protein